jgi:GTPase SAR1 family protein
VHTNWHGSQHIAMSSPSRRNASDAKLKVLLCGPSKAGKSSLASFLANILDSVSPSMPPSPTIGVRVLELERHGVNIELWDVSGDQSYEATWPAVTLDAAGVILVFQPEAPGQAVRACVAAPPPPPPSQGRRGSPLP